MKALLLSPLLALGLVSGAVVAGKDNVGAAPVSADQVATVAAANQFAFDAFKAAAQPAENCALAPLGLRECLALVGEGARGDTGAELNRALGLENDPALRLAQRHACGEILQKARVPGRVELVSRNALWISQKLTPAVPFLETARRDYDAPVTPLDFSSGAGRTDVARRINVWVESVTGGLAGSLDASSLSAETALIASNASKYKLDWAEAFDPRRNLRHHFEAADGSQPTVEFLYRTAFAWYHEEEQFQATSIPYADHTMELLVVLPRLEVSLDEIMKTLTPARVAAIRAAPARHNGKKVFYEVEIALPKFQFRKRTSVTPLLQKLGVEKLFQNGVADLSGIFPETPPSVASILHDVAIETNETGTRIVAVTHAGTVWGTPPETRKVRFAANRPFLFLVRDQASGLILCIGQVAAKDGLTEVAGGK